MIRDLTVGQFLTFGLLTLALAALWLPERQRGGEDGVSSRASRLWMGALGAAVGCGLLFELLDWRGLIAIVAMGTISWGVYRQTLPVTVRAVCGAGVVVLAAGLALHVVPGFNNPKVISDVVLSPNAAPYSEYLNFDKAVVGLFLLAFGQRLISRWREWREALRRTAPIAAATVGVVLVLSLALGYVRLQLALPPFLFVWAWTNLFFTCMAEEAIFRGFIQQGLERGLAAHKLGGLTALLVASVLFGLAHWSGGPKYILLSTAAGFGYGLAMRRSGRIEGSIATHFGLNTLHYVFFTYPALASTVG
jgi:membrane protease YdiL (CAAX protease family)